MKKNYEDPEVKVVTFEYEEIMTSGANDPLIPDNEGDGGLDV